jgi:acetyl esterase/lipase
MPGAFSGAITQELGVVYRTVDGADLKLDLAYPAQDPKSTTNTVAILYVHGGGFQTGGRRDYAAQVQAVARRGIFAASVDYRLADGTPQRKFPAAVQDVACAVRWIKAHAAQYHVDASRIGITGGSAGGNLALMVAVAPELWDADTNRPYAEFDSRVKAVVNYCGPTDYLTMLRAKRGTTREDVIKYLKGGSAKAVIASAREASPVYHLDPTDPPILTLHGTADTMVPYENATRLEKAMKAAGLSHRLIPLPNGDHPGLGGISYRDKVSQETYDFFLKHLVD